MSHDAIAENIPLQGFASSPSGDVGRGAVRGPGHRERVARVEARRRPGSANEARSLVGQDVAVEVGGDYHVVSLIQDLIANSLCYNGNRS